MKRHEWLRLKLRLGKKHKIMLYPKSIRLEFDTEKEARIYLETLLGPWFDLWPETPCNFNGQVLRIDYTAAPKAGVDFPFPWFGVEVKRGMRGDFNNYTEGLKQAIDYTNCLVNGQRMGVAFLFPAIEGGYGGGMAAGAFRLAGRFRVGHIGGEARGSAVCPLFEMCGGRLWDPIRGTVANPPSRDQIAATTRKKHESI